MKTKKRRQNPELTKLVRAVREATHNIGGFLDVTAAEGLTPTQFGYLHHCRTSLAMLANIVEQFSNEPSSVTPDTSGLPSGGHPASPCRPEAIVANIGDQIAKLTGKNHVAVHFSFGSLPDWVNAPKAAITEVLRKLLQEISRTSTAAIGLTTSWNDGMLRFDLRGDACASLMQAGTSEVPWLLELREKVKGLGGEFTSTASGLTLRVPAVSLQYLEQAQEKTTRLSLLVAEDNDESFAVIEAFVSAEDHQIVRAHNGAQAAEEFRAGSFDLVVMDVQMPLVDGYSATRQIREWETANGLARTPIILLSAENPERVAKLGAKVGCSGILSKPTRQAELLRALWFYRDLSRGERSRDSLHPR